MKQEKTQTLFQFDEMEYVHAGYSGPFTAVLVTQEGKQPWIRILGPDGVFRMNEFNLAGMFRPQAKPYRVSQYWGDGPEGSTVPKDIVRKAVEAAMTHLTRHDGHFKVVWVPNDPRIPF